jgi:hypothetical protein
LTVDRRRVVKDEEDLEKLAIGDRLRIEANLHRLGVAGPAGADVAVTRILHVAAGIARADVLHSSYLLKGGLQTPEAAARQRRRLALRHLVPPLRPETAPEPAASKPSL